jgi:hypothetical protein
MSPNRDKTIKANSHVPCHTNVALIYKCHAAPLPFTDSAVSFVKVRVLDGNIRNASPATTLYSNNLSGTPRGSRTKLNAGRSPTCHLWTADANSHILCRSHAAPMPRCAVVLRRRFQNGTVVAWHGNVMAWERHGWRTAWYV